MTGTDTLFAFLLRTTGATPFDVLNYMLWNGLIQ